MWIDFPSKFHDTFHVFKNLIKTSYYYSVPRVSSLFTQPNQNIPRVSSSPPFPLLSLSVSLSFYLSLCARAISLSLSLLHTHTYTYAYTHPHSFTIFFAIFVCDEISKPTALHTEVTAQVKLEQRRSKPLKSILFGILFVMMVSRGVHHPLRVGPSQSVP